MGHSQRDKARNRERILEEAARQVRDQGLESIGIASLMRRVELTHGGFYGHFESRSELLAAALQKALDDGRAASRAAQEARNPDGPGASFEALVRAYLSRAHRDARTTGCAVAALAADVARADEAARRVMSGHVEALADRVAGWVGSPADARLAVSALVGGLVLARVLADPEASDAWLAAVKQGLLQHVGAGAAAEGKPVA